MKKLPKIKITLGEFRSGKLSKALINKTLTQNRLTYGDLTIAFENKFAKFHGRRYGLFTVSGTSALQIALHALKSIHKWKDGDEVMVPAITFIATSNVVLLNNLKPIFVDVDPETYNIDVSEVEKKMTRRTRAIIPVHMFGQSARMDEIMKIAKKHNLKVIEDSCETMLVKYKNRPAGAWGDIACYSTYAAHLLITGVGGLALTDNPHYATKMRSLMNHGRDTIYYNIDHDDKLTTKRAPFRMIDRRFSFIDIGYSYRLTELEAAIGLEGLAMLKDNIARRQKNAKYLLQHLARFKKDLQLPAIEKGAQHAFMMFAIAIREESKIKRKDLITFLELHGIETRYMMPLLNQPIYKKLFGNIERHYPIARWINSNGFYIGCHQFLTKRELRYIVQVFEKFFEEHT